MRRRGPLTLAALLLVPALARGERVWDAHGVASMRSGWSDNIRSSPEDAPPGVPPRDDAAFTTLAPGVVLTSSSARAIHRLGYTAELNTVMGADVSDSLANRFSWEGMVYLAPLKDLRTEATLEHGRTSTFLDFGRDGGVDGAPSGSFDFLRLLANETLSWRPRRAWTVSQTANVSGFAPLTGGIDAGGFDGGAGVGAERSFRSTAVGARTRLGYSRLNGDGGGFHQLTFRGLATLRRDFGERFATRLEGGVGGLLATQRVQAVTRPLWTISMAYLPEWGSGQVTYRRDLRPNLYFGENIDVHEGRLSASWSLPLLEDSTREPRRPITLTVYGGAGLARVVDLRRFGSVEDDWLLARAGARAAWALRRELEVAVSYSHARQERHGELTTSGAVRSFLPFVRNQVVLSLRVRYPAEEGIRIPSLQGARVDGRDIEDADAPVPGTRADGQAGR